MPSQVRFAEVRRMLEEAGYSLVRTNGSHHIFTKEGANLVSIPVHKGQVKHGYVRRIQKAIEEEQAQGEGDDSDQGEDEGA